jgi:mRNA guanylyltransferase
MKEMKRSYGLKIIIENELATLGHKNDGLIFTSMTSPYHPGTSDAMLKWKPPSENSIDFRLHLQQAGDMPVFELHVWIKNDEYEPYATLNVSPAQWQQHALTHRR